MTDEYTPPSLDGSLRGDSRSMPNRGTGTGVSDTYGADISASAKNRKGGLGKVANSDPIDEGPSCNDADDGMYS